MLESVAITETDADHADAVVRFRIFKDDKEKTTQTLKMVAENGRWVIDDIVSNHGSVLQAVNSENEKTLAALASLQKELNRPGFPGECFICELRLPDHRFRWKHNKLFLLLPEEYGPAFPAIVDCYTSPPTFSLIHI
ncbi:hypothetical protein UQ28_07200, partial [Escherichia coli]